VSHVDAGARPGLLRIYVRRAPAGSGFEQRFEYVLRGPAADVAAFAAARVATGARLVETRAAAGIAVALLLAPQPVAVPAGLAGPTFRELRAGVLRGDLAWLWQRLEPGSD
jgi:hypothetical protein